MYIRKEEESENRREEKEPGLSEPPQLLYLYRSASTRVASRLSFDISEFIICLNSVLVYFTYGNSARPSALV